VDVTIVDYHAGNLRSLANAVLRAGGRPRVTADAAEVAKSERIILPGVGAAGPAMQRLRARGLDEALGECVLRRGMPFLGICLGLQLLADELTEFGISRGLGWIPGRVVHLGSVGGSVKKIPHTGWSAVEPGASWSAALGVLPAATYFYFNHSFVFSAQEDKVIAARADCGVPIVAAVARENILATQFHPEISQKAGRRLLASFLNWRP
jgi:glutamine amidotransferase